jgi:2-polyprenyl-3-methyl-5-hydroxy-6-metoxy-1,4-benzoquinol methylase
METSTEEIKRNHKNSMIRTAQRHNMVTHPDESYYQRQYWYWIEKALENLARRMPGFGEGSVVDLGCGQGRLTIPLSKWCLERGCRNTVGVDISASAVDFARESAGQEGMAEVTEFVEDDILVFLQGQKSSSFSVIVCTEVFLFYPPYEKVLQQIARVMVPGGLLVAGFRSRYFNILHSIAQRKMSSLSTLLNQNEGYLWGPPTKFFWHNVTDARKVVSAAGFDILSCRGIGVCSGIEGDPLARIAQPSMLTNEEQDELMAVEVALAEEMANCGRYILVTATKTNDNPQPTVSLTHR